MDKEEFSRRLNSLIDLEKSDHARSIRKEIFEKLWRSREIVEKGKLIVSKPKVFKTGRPEYLCENGLFVIPGILLKFENSQMQVDYFGWDTGHYGCDRFFDAIMYNSYIYEKKAYWKLFIGGLQDRLEEIKSIIKAEHLRVISLKETISRAYVGNDKSLAKEKKLFQKKLGHFFKENIGFAEFTPEEILGFLRVSYKIGKDTSRKFASFANRNKVNFQFVDLDDVHEALQVELTRDMIES